ncbi:pol, partial [Symbiodinium pilosum]
HKLVVAGDMNCNLDHVPTCTGTGMLAPSAVSPDREDLVAILVDFRLRAVNTYGRRGGCTYVHDGYKPARKSFIDYILVRQKGLGKHQAGIIRDWQVARWRQGGRHMPSWTTAQLRTKDGRLMTPAEEAEALCCFWKEVNGGEPPRQVEQLQGYDISKEEVVDALQQLRANKSAPQHCAPHAFWKLAAEQMADYMEAKVFQRWRTGQNATPADWAAAWLVFLSKPGKANDDPKSLRSISLLDPMGKAICGGLQISVDFSQAFDRADRRLFIEAMDYLEVPQELGDLIMRWVRATTFQYTKQMRNVPISQCRVFVRDASLVRPYGAVSLHTFCIDLIRLWAINGVNNIWLALLMTYT